MQHEDQIMAPHSVCKSTTAPCQRQQEAVPQLCIARAPARAVGGLRSCHAHGVQHDAVLRVHAVLRLVENDGVGCKRGPRRVVGEWGGEGRGPKWKGPASGAHHKQR